MFPPIPSRQVYLVVLRNSTFDRSLANTCASRTVVRRGLVFEGLQVRFSNCSRDMVPLSLPRRGSLSQVQWNCKRLQDLSA